MLDLSIFESNKPIKSKPRKLMYGYGINDAPFSVAIRVNGKKLTHPAYSVWHGMIASCYSEERKIRFPSYAGNRCCDEWHSFMAFRSWWVDNHVNGWRMSKDILSDSKMFSPETCIFVPKWMITFLSSPEDSRLCRSVGGGAKPVNGKFRAKCRNPKTGKEHFIGAFNEHELAHKAWREFKLDLAFEFKDEMDAVDCRIYPRMVEIIKRNR